MSFDLRTARLNQGHTLRSLSKEIDVPRATIAALENGGVARPANAKRIADHFGIKVTDLLPAEEGRAA